MIVIITELEGKPFEVFCSLGKSGGCPRAFTEALGRSVSVGLRYDVPIDEYIKQLKDISCPTHALDDGIKISSCPDAIAKVLSQWSKKVE
jgi:ribonucleoside-diphosphate reductase alpha chain